jgi:hypothetical protein
VVQTTSGRDRRELTMVVTPGATHKYVSGEADESAAFVGGVGGSFDASGFGEFVAGCRAR